MDSSEPPSKRFPESSLRAADGWAAAPRDADRGVRNGRKARLPEGRLAADFAIGLMLAVGGGLAGGYALAAPGRSTAGQQAAGFPWDVIMVILALVLLVGFFTASQTALAGMRKTRLRELAEQGVRNTRPAQHLLNEPTRFLSAVQVGITVAGAFAAAAAARVPAEWLGGWLGQAGAEIGMDWLVRHSGEVSLVLVVLLVSFAMLLFGDIIPRQIALRHTERIALRVAGPIRVVAAVMQPAARAVAVLANVLLRPFGGSAEATAGRLTEEEIKNIVEESEKEGVLEEQETEMIHSVLEFTDIVVREVMVPRIDMVCVQSHRSLDDLLDVVLSSGHSRIPIYEETVDNIVGVVHAKDLLRFVRGGPREGDIRSANAMRSVYYVPENMKVDDLLAEFQQTKNQLAIVVDEYGGTAGLVTLEDLLEEIVGPITDEYDVENEPSVSFVDDNEALVDARMSIDDVNEALHLRLPEEESDTLGGFVSSLLGKIPSVGETVQYDAVCIEVVEADSRRVARVKITRQPTEASGTSQTAE